MNLFRCDDCGRAWQDHEVITIKAKTTEGKPVEIRFCPVSRCDGKVEPVFMVADRRQVERRPV